MHNEAMQDHKLPSAIYLCNSPRHLFLSVAESMARGGRDTIFYLADHAPLRPELITALKSLHPTAEFITDTDQALQREFTNLPQGLPGILKRNLRLHARHLFQTARGWRLPTLSSRKYDIAYLYHSGFFAAKPISALADFVVLRESGLNNYHARSVAANKALIRAIFGLSPFAQVWGEERWVDRIEVAHPERLPSQVAAKGAAHSTLDHFKNLAPEKLEDLAKAFIPNGATFAPTRTTPTALLLSQPLSEVGICTSRQKAAIYDEITQTLRSRGYEVHLKPHPLEVDFVTPVETIIPSEIPLEVWHGLNTPTYDIVVACRSFALAETSYHIAKKSIQLVSEHRFNARAFQTWQPSMRETLEVALDEVSSCERN